MSLLRRVVLVNAVLLAVAATVLALSPATVSAEIRVTEGAVLALGSGLLVAANAVVLRRAFAPLRRLTELMGEVDPLEPGRRIEVDRSVGEVAALEDAFNDMLDRLEHERHLSGRRALDAQERERRRLARELHDELGQTLTGIVLLLDGLARRVPPELRAEAEQVQDAARGAVEKTRDIARGLRPQALEEFGLRSALTTLATGFAERTGTRVRHDIDPELPPLSRDVELAVYRTAQESLTNVARHADAASVSLRLARDDGAVELVVADDGRGLGARRPHDDGGIGGMRERAMLVGGSFELGAGALGGTEVRFRAPACGGDAA